MTEIVAPNPYNNPLLQRLPAREVLVASDNFNRANTSYPPVDGQIGSTEVGAFPWTIFSTGTTGTPGAMILDGQMGLITKGNGGGKRIGAWFDSGTSGDVKYRVKFGSGVKDTTMQIPLRGVDVDNHFFLTVSSNKWMLYKRAGGSATLIVEPIGIGYASNGDLVEVEFRGTNIKVLLNGVNIGETTSISYQNGGKFGAVQSLTSSDVDVTTPKALFDYFQVIKYVDWA